MDSQLQKLMSQADELRDGIHQLAEQTQSLQYNLAGIVRCAETIRRCVNLVGNNRVVALPAKDQRKVMAELESAVDELQELLKHP